MPIHTNRKIAKLTAGTVTAFNLFSSFQYRSSIIQATLGLNQLQATCLNILSSGVEFLLLYQSYQYISDTLTNFLNFLERCFFELDIDPECIAQIPAMSA